MMQACKFRRLYDNPPLRKHTTLRIPGNMANPFVLALRRYWKSVPAVLRHNFLLDLTGAVLVGVFVAAINTFVPVIARRLGASPLMLALITAAPAAGNIVAVLAAHYLQGRRKMPYMVWAWSIGRGLFLLMPLIVLPLPFVLIVVAHWLIVSLPVPGYVEVMQQIYPDAYRGRAMAYVRVGYTACIMLMTPLIGRLLDVWSYQYLFPIVAVFGILSGLSFGRVKYEEVISRTRHDLLEPWRSLMKDVRYRDYNIAFFVYGFGALLIAPLVPILLVDELHLNYSQVGWLGMINSVFWMLFYIVWGRTVDRRGGFWTIQVNFILTIFISLAYLFARDMWLVAVGYIFTGITVAGVDLGWMTAIMQFARREQVARYTALQASLVGLRGIAAPLIGITLMAVPWIGLRGVFLLSAFLILLGWLLVRRVTVPERVEEGEIP
jgi:MFS family permease